MMSESPKSPSGIFILRWVLTALVVVVILVALWVINGILLLLLTSIVLVVLLTTPIRFLTKRGMRRGPATILSLLLLPTFFIILSMAVLPLLAGQFSTLTDLVQRGINEIVASWENLDVEQPKYFLGWGDTVILPPQDPVTAGLRFVRSSFQVDAALIQQVASQLLGAFSQLSVSVLPVVGGVASTLLNVL
ncbi:MAG: AI-2E family transporter, partial [Anaerolineae bacterium]|nr:AI-2E family transporter [Anaerolineae bacterium]